MALHDYFPEIGIESHSYNIPPELVDSLCTVDVVASGVLKDYHLREDTKVDGDQVKKLIPSLEEKLKETRESLRAMRYDEREAITGLYVKDVELLRHAYPGPSSDRKDEVRTFYQAYRIRLGALESSLSRAYGYLDEVIDKVAKAARHLDTTS